MNVKEENICRLCLKVAENDFEIIDEIKRETFNVLSLSVNFDISKDPIICKDCRETLKKCLDFKLVCNDTEKRILPFATNKNRTTFESKDVFNNGKGIETIHDNFVCRFCSKQSKGSTFVSLDSFTNDVTFVEKLQALMPKTDFDIKNLVICMSCNEDLECYINFAKRCLDVEENINKYRQNSYDTCYSAQITLSDVLQSCFKTVSEWDNSQTHAIKKEKDTLEDIGETHLEIYDNELIKAEELLDIKNENINFDQTTCETLSDNLNIRELKSETDMGKIQKISGYKEGTEKAYKKALVNEIKHLPSTKNVTEAIIFKCGFCAYQTERKYNLKNHMLIHKYVTEVEMHKCSMCTYETKCKDNLKSHTLIHNDITGVEMYKCSTCIYKTKRKDHLNRHMLTHKHITEVEVYKCSLCTHTTKRKDLLTRHMLVHKDMVEILQCPTCAFQTKRKCYLKSHMLIHKHVTEVEMYKCSMCTYETKRKSNLGMHMLIHKDNTKVKMYKCSMCTYETKHKSNLNSHMLIHKDITEVEMHKCSECNYETRHKGSIKTHIKKHK